MMLDSRRDDQGALRAGEGAGAARVGIGGPVGSGKTALIEALIPALQRRGIDFAVVTNDLVTKEDAERLRRSGLIDPARVSAVEAGACPHTVIRDYAERLMVQKEDASTDDLWKQLDEKAIEKEAREQLGYAKPGEYVYVAPAPAKPVPPANHSAKR